MISKESKTRRKLSVYIHHPELSSELNKDNIKVNIYIYMCFSWLKITQSLWKHIIKRFIFISIDCK